MSIEGPRVLGKTTNVAYSRFPTGGPGTFTGHNWVSVGPNTYALRSYYDLSGYNREDLTCFFQGVDIQEGTFCSTNMAQMNIVDLITTEFMTDTACLEASAAGFDAGDAPGFPHSDYNMEQVVYGRRRTWVRQSSTNTNADVTPFFNTCMYGTCAAASADKLHITRIVSTSLPPGEDDFTNISPAHYVLAIIVSKEKELPYLMRQKRSYEIATGP